MSYGRQGEDVWNVARADLFAAGPPGPRGETAEVAAGTPPGKVKRRTLLISSRQPLIPMQSLGSRNKALSTKH
jgi:hypothetical protein